LNGTPEAAACPCGSGRKLADCCGPLLAGTALASSPEQLMRSRYSAYALGGHGEYLLATWFPATARGLTAEALSGGDLSWCGLEVIDSSCSGDDGTVAFRASYRDQRGRAGVLREQAVFRLVGQRWLYVGGEVGTETPASKNGGQSQRRAAASPGRNSLCPCGSGRKFKRCCGA